MTPPFPDLLLLNSSLAQTDGGAAAPNIDTRVSDKTAKIQSLPAGKFGRGVVAMRVAWHVVVFLY